MIDIAKMIELKRDLYSSAVQRAFGSDGQAALKLLLSGIVQVYRRIDPGLRKHPLAFFAYSTGTASINNSSAYNLSSISRLTYELDGACIARIKADSSLEVTPFDDSLLEVLSKTAIVYVYSGGVERFIVDSVEYQLTNPILGCASVFCKPTYTNLSTALDTYRLQAASYTSCLILEDVWNESDRLWFKTKPEHIMRKSLVQYLRHVLADAEVRPEQNVDETHPVDIHVTFSMSDQRAIIEIKWLGRSIDSSSIPGTNYSQARALAGAKQLAEYLDSSKTWGPNVRTRGYLVVFDGRRKGLKAGATSLTTANAMYFKNQEIKYSPDYNLTRDDFDRPIRMFMHPRTA